jgi:bacterioferritin-associated ferredoxin
LRARRPAVASQLSECYGAGTGCGWCRPFLRRLHQQIVVGTLTQADAARADAARADAARADDEAIDSVPASLPDAESYAAERESFRAAARADAKPPDEPLDNMQRPASSGDGTQARIPGGG